MTMKISLLSALCGAAIATGAVAQENTPVDPANISLGQRIAMSYANLSDDYFKDLLAPEQLFRLIIVTKQQVVATACDGFKLDEARMNDALNAILGTQPKDENGEFSILIFGRIMHGYGIIKGGEIALATYDPDAYCTYGNEVIELFSEKDPDGLLVLSASE